MSKQTFFNDAIAEAKVIRETAFSNAKLALSESFAPQIKSMLSSQLNEMEEDEYVEDEVSLDELLSELEASEELPVNNEDPTSQPGYVHEDAAVNSAAAGLDNIVAQIKAAIAKTPALAGKFKQVLADLGAGAGAALRSEGADELDEYGRSASRDTGASAAAGLDAIIAKIKSAAAKSPQLISKLKQTLADAGSAAGAAMRNENIDLEEAEGEDEVAEITVDELKDIIRDVMGELQGEDEVEDSEEVVDFEDETSDDEEIDLDEVLSEMGGGVARDTGASAAAGLDNIVAQIKAAIAKTPALAGKFKQVLADLGAGAGAALRSESAELEEARKLITKQTKVINETNLLNSKLLYVNKIFKAKNLTESQKLKVVNALDRGRTVKETENIFQILKETLIITPSKSINENRGRASKSAGTAPQRLNEGILNQQDDFVARMQKLAGIN